MSITGERTSEAAASLTVDPQRAVGLRRRIRAHAVFRKGTAAFESLSSPSPWNEAGAKPFLGRCLCSRILHGGEVRPVT